jgi:hypothetical protein
MQGYDILEIKLERTGDNLTTVSNGEVNSNGGRGLVGAFYVGAPDTLATPPPTAFEKYRPISNLSSSVEFEYFCTLAPQSGTYTIAVVPGTTAQGGFGPELFTTEAEAFFSVGVPRQGRGRYRMHVRHAQFKDGQMSSPSNQPGCLDFGQTRNYSLTSMGMHDANLYVELTGANVTKLRARCAGCDWIEAAPPLSALAASPCYMRNVTEWEVQLMLADFTSATLSGIPRSEFYIVRAWALKHRAALALKLPSSSSPQAPCSCSRGLWTLAAGV